MPLPGSPGSIVPPGDDWIAKRFKELEDRINQLVTAQSGNAMTIDGLPGISVQGGGNLRIYDPDGNLVAEIGVITDGNGGNGIRLMRTDGSTALRFRGGFIGLNDAQNNHIFSDDINGGVGIATPHIPQTPPIDTNTFTWPATTSTSWTAIATGTMQRQNPGIFWSLWCQVDAATTGQFRIKIDGTVVATSPAVTGTFSTWSAAYYWPAGWVFNTGLTFTIEAIRTAGTGTVRAAVLQLTGVQSP